MSQPQPDQPGQDQPGRSIPAQRGPDEPVFGQPTFGPSVFGQPGPQQPAPGPPPAPFGQTPQQAPPPASPWNQPPPVPPWNQQQPVPPWSQPPPPKVPKEPRKADRGAVALGNASLLSVGYFMLGRIGAGVLSLVVTIALVVIALPAVHTVWFEIVCVLWWLAMIAHGWFLGRPGAPRRTRTIQYAVAACFAVPVLFVIALLRVDAGHVGGQVADAKAAGDCARATKALSGRSFLTRIVDGPQAKKDDATITVCKRLKVAAADLDKGLGGDSNVLNGAFNELHAILTGFPGHQRMVGSTLDNWLGKLPTADSCATADVAAWVGARPKTNDELDRSVTVVPKVAPAAFFGCGNAQVKANHLDAAKISYQTLISYYPSDPNVPAARADLKQVQAKIVIAARQAQLASELSTARDALQGVPEDAPDYCTSPVKYELARAYGKGTNKAIFGGNSDESNSLPAAWRGSDPTNATLVVCLGPDTQGAAVRSCSYQEDFYGTGVGSSNRITFHKVNFTVKAIEIRTGRVVASKTVTVTGTPCPANITYDGDTPPKDMNVTVSNSSVQSALKSLIVR